jgi:predicted transcriptional regulator
MPQSAGEGKRADIMPDRDKAAEQAIMLELLGAVEKGGITQRKLSSELGIAVGLVNAYIKRCISKGYIKVTQAPPRRYAYYLTPKGFLEKSRLVAEYFVYSFDFFRRARTSCEAALAAAEAAGHRRLALIGASELTEITLLVATEGNARIVTIVDPDCPHSRFHGVPVTADLASVAQKIDAAVITSLSQPLSALQATVDVLGKSRVHVPSVLTEIAGTPKAPLRAQPMKNADHARAR